MAIGIARALLNGLQVVRTTSWTGASIANAPFEEIKNVKSPPAVNALRPKIKAVVAEPTRVYPQRMIEIDVEFQKRFGELLPLGLPTAQECSPASSTGAAKQGAQHGRLTAKIHKMLGFGPSRC